MPYIMYVGIKRIGHWSKSNDNYKVVDSFGYKNTRLKMFELLDLFVEEISGQNFVELANHNSINNVLAGKHL